MSWCGVCGAPTAARIITAAFWRRDVDLVEVVDHAVYRVEHRAVGIVLAAALPIHQVERGAQRCRERRPALLAPRHARAGIVAVSVGAVLKTPFR